MTDMSNFTEGGSNYAARPTGLEEVRLEQGEIVMEAIRNTIEADQREWTDREHRVMTTLLLGKLFTENSGANLCRIRNVSENGMMIESHRSLIVNRNICVELRSGTRLEGRVAWANQGRAGVQFHQPIDYKRVLADANIAPASGKGALPRAPRFDIECAGRISNYGRSIDVVIENVSQSGARLRMSRPPKQESEVILSIPGLPSRRCVTRWATEEAAGLAFLDSIPYRDFSLWLEHMTAGE